MSKYSLPVTNGTNPCKIALELTSCCALKKYQEYKLSRKNIKFTFIKQIKIKQEMKKKKKINYP